MKISLLISFTLALVSPLCAQSQLRFEDKPGTAPPAPFIYDPGSGKSVENLAAWKVDGKQTLETGLTEGDSFTVEAFAKPDAVLEMKPRQMVPVFAFPGNAHLLVAGIRRSPQPHSYQWWHVRSRKGKAPPLDLSRNRYNGLTMVKGETPWRHLAITWQADTRTLSAWLDYRLLQSTVLEERPDWDLSTLEIGRSAQLDQAFSGAIDELRVTPKALPPHLFLRSSSVGLSDVSFAPETEPALPEDYGHVNVRLHYGAVGDGIHDDTEAIRRAFEENDNRVPIAYETVYFPEGTYRITGPIRFSRFMVVRGAGKDKTIIRLDDNAEGYDDPDVPAPLSPLATTGPTSGGRNGNGPET